MSGPGKPDCPLCGGEGVYPVEGRSSGPPAFQRCKCILHLDLLANAERGMRGLSKAPTVKESPLADLTGTNVWITATRAWFMPHLRHTVIRQPPTWYFKVASDVDLMVAWLASVALKGQEILDPDASEVSTTYLTLVDLVTPPQLLVIRLGVKAARNAATPEVVLETLHHRGHLNLPTWVWDQPSYRLDEGHIGYSPQVKDYLSDWKHVHGDDSFKDTETAPDMQDLNLPAPASPIRTMSDADAKRKSRRKA